MERLALHTQLWAVRSEAQAKGAPAPTQLDYQRIAIQINSMSRTEHRELVSGIINRQILGTASALHKLLQQAGDPAPTATQLQAACQALRAPSDKDPTSQQQQAARGRTAATTAPASPEPRPKLSAGEVSQLLKSRLGFTLRVQRSTIQHPQAGHGLFVDGKAPVGAVVALLPGLWFQRTQLSRMPNYPQVSLGNDFLSSRYDMTIIDSQAWMQAATAGPGPQGEAEAEAWHQRYARWALGALEARHPLALGHWVNHPAPGMHPNVLEVAWDVVLDLSQPDSACLRAYLPVAPALDLDMARPAPMALLEHGAKAHEAGASREAEHGAKAGGTGPWVTARGLALVATRHLQDGEEVLQNYRLSPHAPRPAWYTSYSAEEEERRWAPLAFSRLLSY